MALMLSAWEPIWLRRTAESSLCPGFQNSTGELLESINPASPLGVSRCQLIWLNAPALPGAFIAASPGRMSDGGPNAADTTVTWARARAWRRLSAAGDGSRTGQGHRVTE